MLKGKYCILSFPEKEKHFVLRTAEDDGDIMLKLDNIIVNASMSSINDSYEDARQVLNNLSK